MSPRPRRGLQQAGAGTAGVVGPDQGGGGSSGDGGADLDEVGCRGGPHRGVRRAPTNGSIGGPLISFWKKWLYANEILKFLVKLYEAPSAIFCMMTSGLATM